MIPSTPENIELVRFIKLSKDQLNTLTQAIDDYKAWLEILNSEIEEGEIIDPVKQIIMQNHQSQIKKLKEMAYTTSMHISSLTGKLFYNANKHIIENMDIADILIDNNVMIPTIIIPAVPLPQKNKSILQKIIKSIF